MPGGAQVQTTYLPSKILVTGAVDANGILESDELSEYGADLFKRNVSAPAPSMTITSRQVPSKVQSKPEVDKFAVTSLESVEGLDPDELNEYGDDVAELPSLMKRQISAPAKSITIPNGPMTRQMQQCSRASTLIQNALDPKAALDNDIAELPTFFRRSTAPAPSMTLPNGQISKQVQPAIGTKPPVQSIPHPKDGREIEKNNDYGDDICEIQSFLRQMSAPAPSIAMSKGHISAPTPPNSRLISNMQARHEKERKQSMEPVSESADADDQISNPFLFVRAETELSLPDEGFCRLETEQCWREWPVNAATASPTGVCTDIVSNDGVGNSMQTMPSPYPAPAHHFDGAPARGRPNYPCVWTTEGVSFKTQENQAEQQVIGTRDLAAALRAFAGEVDADKAMGVDAPKGNGRTRPPRRRPRKAPSLIDVAAKQLVKQEKRAQRQLQQSTKAAQRIRSASNANNARSNADAQGGMHGRSATQQSVEKRFCPFCGGSVLTNFKFCQFCGADVATHMKSR